jgi:hypothetical protein
MHVLHVIVKINTYMEAGIGIDICPSATSSLKVGSRVWSGLVSTSISAEQLNEQISYFGIITAAPIGILSLPEAAWSANGSVDGMILQVKKEDMFDISMKI